MMGLWTLVALLAIVSDDEKLEYRGPGFTLEYPEDDSRLQPSSAAVPFQLVYRKNSLLRLETERLTQPIDLTDETFAEIFMEVQLERLRERVSVPLESKRIREFSFGPGIELVYYLPARSGRKNRRDLVTEVTTTVGETLYRFTYWIPERDLGRVAAPFAQIVESFEPEGLARTVDSASSSAPRGRYSAAAAAEAIEAYRRELQEQGESAPDAAELSARLTATLGWKAYLEEGASAAELEEMRRAAGAALEAAPNAAASHRARAWLCYHEDRMVEMEAAIKEALAIEPADAASHLLYALWYGFSTERSEAMARRAIEEDPELVGAYYVKARADRRAGDLAEAREALEKAVELDPGFLEAHLELGQVLRESGDHAAALEAYRAGAFVAPDDVNARFQLALALRQSGRVDEAITEYQSVLQIDPSLAEVYYNLGVLLLQEKQRPELAAEHFRRFLELDPESPKAPPVRDWLTSNGYR